VFGTPEGYINIAIQVCVSDCQVKDFKPYYVITAVISSLLGIG
jgi:hypothetical protein